MIKYIFLVIFSVIFCSEVFSNDVDHKMSLELRPAYFKPQSKRF